MNHQQRPPGRHPFVLPLVICTALSCALPTSAPANVIATNLMFSAPAFAPGGGTVTLSYMLNEDARNGVTVRIYRASDDLLVRTYTFSYPADDQTKRGPQPGYYPAPVPVPTPRTVVWDGRNQTGSYVSLSVPYYFTVTASDTGYTDWTPTANKFNQSTYFAAPRGVGVNTNPSSPYYGRVYVSESIGAGVRNRTTQQGIYLLNADLTDAIGQGDTAATGGVSWAVDTTDRRSPWRVRVGADDQVYVTDLSDAHPGVWIGDSDFSSAVPVLDYAGPDAVALSAGWNYGLALKPNGTVAGWGQNNYGQAVPPPGLSGVVAISAGWYHGLALKSDGTVVGWGRNDYLQATPPAGLTGVVAIAAGGYHSLALKSDGTVVGWGSNSDPFGTANQATPPSGLGGVTAVSAGGYHSLALKSDGTVVGWGSNKDPNGVVSNQSVPPTGLTDATGISAGGWHSLALKSNRSAVGWGWNGFDQAYDATHFTSVVAVAAGGYHSLALTPNGIVQAGGRDTDPNGVIVGQATPPVGLTGVAAIAAGGYHSLALKSDGGMVGFGWAAYHQNNPPAGLRSNHGGVASCLVDGVGQNRKLYTLDEDYPATTTAPVGSIWLYDAANYIQPWTKAPAPTPYDDTVNDLVQNYPKTQYGGVSFSYVQNVGAYPLNSSAGIARDSAGNWYISQPNYRGYGILDYGSQKAYGNLLKVDPTGTLVFDSIRDWGCREPLYNPTGVAVNSARNRIAVTSSALINNGSAMIFDYGVIHIVDMTTLNPETMQTVWPPAVSLAVGNNGTILRKTRWTGAGGTGGTSAWTQVGAGITTENLKGVACQQTMWDSGSQLAYAVGGNKILRSQDAGAAWALWQTVTDGANTVSLRGVKAFPYKKKATGAETDYVHLVGVSTDPGGGTHAYFARQGGGTKEIVPPEAEPYGLNCSWQTLDRREVTYICGDHGTIFKTNNYGGDYWMLTSNTTENLNSICEVWHDGGGFGNTLWCVGDNGTVLKASLWLYAEEGSFSQVPIPESCQTKKLVSVCQTTSKIIKILASDGTVLKTTDGEAAGPTWTVIPPPAAGLSAMFFEDTAGGLAVGPGGTVLKTADGGATWTSETSGVSVDLNGVYVQPLTEWAESWYNQWSDVAFDAAGNLYAPDFYNVSILRVWSPPDGPNSMTTSSKTYALVVPTSGHTAQPGTPLVTDDGNITWVNTQLHATWPASTCPDGDAIAEYRYAISGVPMDIGHDYVVGWTSAGTSLSVTKTALSLSPGAYYFLVKAKCSAGVWSGVGASDGIKVLIPSMATTIGRAKTQGLGSLAILKDVVTTATFDTFEASGASDKFNVGEPGEDSGVMALTAGSLPAIGDQLSLMGWLRIGTRGATISPADDTVYIELSEMQPGSSGVALPVVSMNTGSLGGGGLGLQGGVDGGIGTNTIGLLTRICGTVTGSGFDPLTFLSYAYVDDGANVPNDSTGPVVTGVKCFIPFSLGVPSGSATVTGVSGRQYDPTAKKMIRTLWVTNWF